MKISKKTNHGKMINFSAPRFLYLAFFLPFARSLHYLTTIQQKRLSQKHFFNRGDPKAQRNKSLFDLQTLRLAASAVYFSTFKTASFLQNTACNFSGYSFRLPYSCLCLKFCFFLNFLYRDLHLKMKCYGQKRPSPAITLKKANRYCDKEVNCLHFFLGL